MRTIISKALLSIIVIGGILSGLLFGCEEAPCQSSRISVKEGEILYQSNKLIAPGAKLISEGQTFENEVKVGEGKLVGIEKDGRVYIYFTGLTNKAVPINEQTSKVSLANFIAHKYLQNGSMKSSKGGSIQDYQWELSTGLGINQKSSNQYEFSNFKMRWAAVDNSQEIKYLMPKTFIKWSFVDWDNIMGFDLAESKAIDYIGQPYKTYGSVISALASPGNSFLIDQNNLRIAYNENPDLVIRLNAAEFFDIMISGIEQIVGLLPDGNCLDATLFNFIYNTFKTIGFDLLLGKEVAKEAMTSQTEDYFNEIGICIVSAAGVAVAGPIVEEFLTVLSSLAWVGQMSVASWDAATSKYYAEFYPTQGNTILYENFENSTLDSRISIEKKGHYTKEPIVSYVTNFESKVFGFGKSSCYADCYNRSGIYHEQPYSTTIKITFPTPISISSVSFREAELDGNWGSVGYVLVDGENITGDTPFGINPNSNNASDVSVRSRTYSINKNTRIIEFGVWDITNSSEIFIDDIEIRGN